MTKTAKSLCFILIAVLLIFKAQAQQTININASGIYPLERKADDPLVSAALKDAEHIRAFSYNPQLKGLNNQNKGDTLLLDFFEDRKFKAVVKNTTVSKDGIVGITAQLTDSDLGFCFISISDKGISISADIPQFDEQFRAAEINGKTYLSKYSMGKVQKTIIEGSNPITPPASLSTERGLKSGEVRNDCDDADDIEDYVTLDVMFVYTAAAAEWAAASSDATDIDHLIDIAMQRSNLAMDNSKTGIRFNMVHKYQTTYVEVNNDEDLSRLPATNDGHLDEVHPLREQYKADLVVFMPKVDFTGGVAYLLTDEAGNRYYCTFSLSRVQQSASTYTVVHEIGHNMGCGHNYSQNYQAGPGLYTYSSGWRGFTASNNAYCSIMTYEEAQYYSDGRRHTRIPYFSSPDIVFEGVTIGDTQLANNVLTLKKTKHVTSRYEAKPVIKLTIPDFKKIRGETDPSFTYDICGNLGANEKIVISREEGEEAGIYKITANIYDGTTDITHQYELYYTMATLEIEPKCVLYATDQAEICLNTPFTWEGISFNVSTAGIKTETKTLLSRDGCDSIVTFTLTVESSPKISPVNSRLLLCTDSDIAVINYTTNAEIEKFILRYSNNAIEDGFVNSEYYYSQDNKITINLPSNIQSGSVYSIYITPVSITGCEGNSTTVTMHILYPSDGIIIQKWNDVLACNNKEGNYMSYQWYRNGVAISGAVKQFYQVKSGQYNDLYHVALTTTSGAVFETCQVTLNQNNLVNSSEMFVYPNPVEQGQTITLNTQLNDSYELEGASVSIYNLNGGILTTFKADNENIEFKAPTKSGLYLIVLQSRYGSKTFRVLVK